MSSKIRTTFIVVALIVTTSLSLIPTHAQALSPHPDTNRSSNLQSFAASVTNGQDVLTGIFVEDTFAYPVVQQPSNDVDFVSSAKDTLTQFRTPSTYGNIGVLAHNYLAGNNFSKLTAGQHIHLVYGTGRVETFKVSQVYRYEALSPNSSTTDLKDPTTGMVYNTEYIFRKMYTGDRKVTFQTCIEKNGNLNWGRMFIIATPVP